MALENAKKFLQLAREDYALQNRLAGMCFPKPLLPQNPDLAGTGFILYNSPAPKKDHHPSRPEIHFSRHPGKS